MERHHQVELEPLQTVGGVDGDIFDAAVEHRPSQGADLFAVRGSHGDPIGAQHPSAMALALDDRVHVGRQCGGDEIGRQVDELGVARKRRRGRQLEVCPARRGGGAEDGIELTLAGIMLKARREFECADSRRDGGLELVLGAVERSRSGDRSFVEAPGYRKTMPWRLGMVLEEYLDGGADRVLCETAELSRAGSGGEGIDLTLWGA